VAGALEQELQRRHVPAAVAAPHHPAPQPRPAAPAECPPRLRPGDAVRLQAAPLLEGDHGPAGEGAVDPVDVAAVEVQALQRRLQRGDVRGRRSSARRRGEEGDDQQGEADYSEKTHLLSTR
jgi:hypothetical protein